jgi:hypothetical protein
LEDVRLYANFILKPRLHRLSLSIASGPETMVDDERDEPVGGFAGGAMFAEVGEGEGVGTTAYGEACGGVSFVCLGQLGRGHEPAPLSWM